MKSQCRNICNSNRAWTYHR